ncbi:uncharacterized protein LOC110442009 isoform X2 [Mizuhopecten yessoensis]|uniref:uncharacterized protein LOC110442009 isoform X2 n=1 Tax=Mizuhopecten yessoensis TaxID=6573 RepID=UPI000B45ADED|nr:uncharacterized protein LOC110442009 isoform X2 [Mizuhopecten yessoensis]
MFTLRAAPHHYPDFCWGRRPSTCRQTFTPRQMPRYTYPWDSCLFQDWTDTMLLPLFESMMNLKSDKQYGQHKRPKAKNWVRKLNLRGYGPDDVTITTKAGCVLIKARRIEGEGDCSDVYESNRSVTIPEGVDVCSMKSHFSSDGVLTIIANVTIEDENKESLEVPVEIVKEKQKSLPAQDGKGDSKGDTQNSDAFVYPESVGSFIGKEDFEVVEPERTNTDGDLNLRGTDLTIDFDQSLTENGDAGLCPNEELEIHHEDVETHVEEAVEKCEEDGKSVIDETQKAFKLSFNKDQLAGDDVKVLVKDNCLLVKSQSKTCEDGKSVIDETQKAFKLSFNKDQLAGDDVKVLVKDNCLLVKSQSKTCEGGVSRSVYYATQHTLPDDIDVSKLSCSKRSDGEFLVTAPYIRS